MSRVFVVCTMLVLVVLSCAAEDTAGESSSYMEITFDGDTCTAPDPDRLPAGGHAFVLTNNSGYDRAWLFVGSLTDGYVYQDLIDAQNAAGGPPHSLTHMDWFPHEMASFDPADIPDVDLASHQTLYPFVLTPGLDAVGLATPAPSPLLWFCGPLEISET